jgi:hypothetical protein
VSRATPWRFAVGAGIGPRFSRARSRCHRSAGERSSPATAQRSGPARPHHRPDPVGEHVGVGLAEIAAVGKADVGELLLAHQGAQMVEVAGGIGGRDVRQKPAADLARAPSQRGGVGHKAPRFRPRLRERVAGPETRLRGIAAKADGLGAGVGAAGIPADHVEAPAAERVDPLGITLHQADASVARPARIDEQRHQETPIIHESLRIQSRPNRPRRLVPPGHPRRMTTV